MSDERDTLPGTDASAPTARNPLDLAVRQAIAEALAPFGQFMAERSQLMLDVVADAAEARAQVRSAVRMIKVTVWVKVAIVLGASLAVNLVLDGERQDRRRAVEMQEGRRDTAVDLINAHIDRVCRPQR
jgi:hypothetical protein